MKKPLLFATFCLLPFACCLAQKGWTFEANTGFGSVIRHTPKITIGTGQLVPSVELAADFQTSGKKDWHAWKKYPRFGLAAAHFSLGEAAHGRLFGVMPTLTTPVLTRQNWSLKFRLGSGAGWISRPFDIRSNPGQNAIGSHVNCLIQFRLAATARVSKTMALLAGGEFTHASNGGSAQPNFGVNVPSFFVAAQFAPAGFLDKKAFEPGLLPKKMQSKKPSARLGATVSAAFARQESQTFDGPKYPVFVGSALAAWSFNRANRGLFGAEWELHRSVQFFLAHANGQDENLEKYRPEATRWAVFAGDEMWFGPVAILVGSGFYLSKRSELTTFFLYNKLAMRWHFPVGNGRQKPFVGVLLKSHKVIAEYVALTAGCAF